MYSFKKKEGIKRNPAIVKLASSYLFSQIAQKKQELLKKYPEAKLINLGIGDTTLSLPKSITSKIASKALALSTKQGYQGYGTDFGMFELREKIASTLYSGLVSPHDIFISDGAKCDVGRLQFLFGPSATISVQNPTYPAYLSSSVIAGKGGEFDSASGKYNHIQYLDCSPSNNFFPNLENAMRTDLIYICSPNNPTGAVLEKWQLQKLVEQSKKWGSIIIFDSAYSSFIQDSSLPKSIYEIQGADEVAIEIGSFSKFAGFTGLRLGWSVIPKKLCFLDGLPIQEDWKKVLSANFNEASSLTQVGGIAALELDSLNELDVMKNQYLKNARRLKLAFNQLGYQVYGGENAPYLWVDLQNRSSWKVFDQLLNSAHIITTPGVGFGPLGEGFLRLSAFASPSEIEKAIVRLNNLTLKTS